MPQKKKGNLYKCAICGCVIHNKGICTCCGGDIVCQCQTKKHGRVGCPK